ncbi:chromatin structure-remodeling complex protein RSC7 [Nannizzia gypsea CBS 118893]|uniref:Chromatin structure-remodeling complex protein RSC7 n=1 Tax=Arthroderma gypseum (strain ATCC MYA-4604 / CBS 118893) TaxID=535722 RepID=E4UND7_ARTGP|nr:chromatin structure-remodeling complex protein RSC7 [Nannizzia gypsea CBS 118893]EFR00387.1 chromatin structure-remodeling complex protein RSC7 [Nannizzia gypsea CBS 118893]
MYTTSAPAQVNGGSGMGNNRVDSGTINPADLNSPISLPSTVLATDLTADATGSRGIKRSRSEDQYGEQLADQDIEDDSRRKRGRPPKATRPPSTSIITASHNNLSTNASGNSINLNNTPIVATTITTAAAAMASSQSPLQTPRIAPDIPLQSSPPKATPTKSVLKALPTVRDHTTDQLGEDGDEYIPKEFDANGEKKVDGLGYLQDTRTYKCRTFRLSNRGNKLFMLATECARVLGYRDSYLLFNKNRSLFKIIANQAEKDDLIAQDILPYSYRSRQIAIVTARSMFRQFGSRVIVNGRRVRDDYWESKAIKQGFTEEDMAGEKRPGAGKAREAAAAEAAASMNAMPSLGHNDVIYTNTSTDAHGLPSTLSHPASLAPLPMINPAPSDDPRLREYNSLPRPRQDLGGQPYQDRSVPSAAADIVNQASHTAEFSKILNQQRSFRAKGLEDHWNRPREIPISDVNVQTLPSSTGGSQLNTNLQSPQLNSSGMISSLQPQPLLQQPQTVMTPHTSYSPALHHQQQQPQHHQQPQHQQPSMSPPLRTMQQQQGHHRSPNNPMSLPLSSTPVSLPVSSQSSLYAYPQQQFWGAPPQQPLPHQQPQQHHPSQPSPSHTQHQPQHHQSIGMQHPQYASPLHNQHHPHHPSQSPGQRQLASPQLQPQQQQPHTQQPGMNSMAYPGVVNTAYSMAGPGAAAGARMYTSPGMIQQPFGMGVGGVSAGGAGMMPAVSAGTGASLPWSPTGPQGQGQAGPQGTHGSWPGTY